MGITKSGDIVTVEFQDGDASGNSAANPIDVCEEIYAEDQANGWGVFHKYGDYNYHSEVSILLKGSNTYVRFAHVNLSWENRDYTANYIIKTENNPHVEISGNPSSPYGLADTVFSAIKMGGYDPRIYLNNVSSLTVRDVTFNDIYLITFKDGTLSRVTLNHIDNLTMPDSGGSLTVSDINIKRSLWIAEENFQSANNIRHLNCGYGVLLGFDGVTLRNVYFDPLNYDLFIRMQGGSGLENYFIDSKLDISNFYCQTIWNGDMTVYNQTTMKINIQGGDSGTAKLYDTDNNEIFSEVISGELEKVVTFETQYVEVSGGNLTGDTYTDKTPFKLVVTKDGYDDLEIPGITVTAGDITKIFGEMKKKTFYERDIAVVVADTQELSVDVEDTQEIAVTVD